MRQRRFALLAVLGMLALGCGAGCAYAERSDARRAGGMAEPSLVPQSGMVHDSRGYTQYDP